MPSLNLLLVSSFFFSQKTSCHYEAVTCEIELAVCLTFHYLLSRFLIICVKTDELMVDKCDLVHDIK